METYLLGRGTPLFSRLEGQTCSALEWSLLGDSFFSAPRSCSMPRGTFVVSQVCTLSKRVVEIIGCGNDIELGRVKRVERIKVSWKRTCLAGARLCSHLFEANLLCIRVVFTRGIRSS